MRSAAHCALVSLCLGMLSGGCGGGTSPGSRSGKDLKIMEVSCNPGPVVMSQRTRKIIATVSNVGSAAAQLWVGSNDGTKVSKEQHEIETQFMTEEDGVDRELPYGLGIESRSTEEGEWHQPLIGRVWFVEGEGEASKGGTDGARQVEIPAGGTRSFTILVPAAGELFADKAFRVFIINPEYQRIDERKLVPE